MKIPTEEQIKGKGIIKAIIAIACLTFFPMVYLIGTWIKELLEILIPPYYVH